MVSSKAKIVSIVFRAELIARSAKSEDPARLLVSHVTRAGSREPSVECRMNYCYEGSAWKTHGRGRGSPEG
jgi:hypothetical protein